MEKGITIMMGSPDQVGVGGERVAKYGVGRKCRGKVVNFKPYGFFVETEDGGFGLVHGRNIRGWKWGLRFDKVFRHGSEIDVEVVDIEEGTNRMSFACEMPTGYADEVEPGIDSPKDDDLPPPPSRREVAEKWRAENAEKSKAAYEWLVAELTDGPLYGPLTNVLCDRFEVPVPVSQWILLFPGFTCYSGKGDNPSDLPAVALSARAGEVAYWDRIKVRNDDLLENRNRGEDDTAKFAALMKRLDAKGVFPSAKWMRGYAETAKGLVRGKGVYGRTDTVERLVIPMLGELGWDVSSANAAFVRGDDSTFDVRIFGGAASSGKVALAVKCAPAGTSFASAPSAVEDVLGLYNRLGGNDPAGTKVVWTDGNEWLVFTRALLLECIGVLAEHRGADIAAAMDEKHFTRISFPADATPFTWLSAFADLHDAVGV